MLTIGQIAAIMGLLMAFGVDPITLGNVQLALSGQPTITSATTTNMTQAQPPAQAPTTATPPAEKTSGSEQVATAPASKARIEIIKPNFVRAYKAYDWDTLNKTSSVIADSERPSGFVFPSEDNQLDVTAIVYGEDGGALKSATVRVVATDASQNRDIVGTGAVVPIYVNGQKMLEPAYSFHYEIKSAGAHTVTLSANGVEASVEIEAK